MRLFFKAPGQHSEARTDLKENQSSQPEIQDSNGMTEDQTKDQTEVESEDQTEDKSEDGPEGKSEDVRWRDGLTLNHTTPL